MKHKWGLCIGWGFNWSSKEGLQLQAFSISVLQRLDTSLAPTYLLSQKTELPPRQVSKFCKDLVSNHSFYCGSVGGGTHLKVAGQWHSRTGVADPDLIVTK